MNMKLINVLIRTRRSPEGFKRAYDSVKRQNYPDTKIIASYDEPATLKYLYRYPDVELTAVQHVPKKDHKHCPYNLYLNHLFRCVKDGWIFILDDDDWICDDKFFSVISEKMTSEKILIMWKMRMESGRVIPEDEYFMKDPVPKHVGMPCFTFHSSNKHLHTFNDKRRGDYQLISALYPNLPFKIWINGVFVQLGNDGRHGKI